MAKFTIFASETAYYEVEVEATTEQEAIKKFYDLNFCNIEPVDYGNFQVDYAVESKEAEHE